MRQPAVVTRPVALVAALAVVLGLLAAVGVSQGWGGQDPASSRALDPAAAAPTPAPPAPTSPVPTSPAPTGSPAATPAPLVLPEPPPMSVEIARGEFEPGVRAITGRAVLVAQGAGDAGQHYLRLTGLTDPVADARPADAGLRVWLSPVRSGADPGAYDDADHLDLGRWATDREDRSSLDLDLPADVDLGSIRSVVLWSDRLDAALGTAPLSVR